MFKTPPMVDLKRTSADKQETASLLPYNAPDYPYGLAISLDEESLEKLDVDFDNVDVDENYHLFILAKITAKSRNESVSGKPRRCIELQITHMAAESEDEENAKVEHPRKKMYKK